MNKKDLDLLTDWCIACSFDPLRFVYEAFEWGKGELMGHDGPDKWQIDILTDIKSGLLTINEAIQLAVASGHGIGKSALVSWLILWAISTRIDTKGVVTANTENQLRLKTWAELAKWHRLSIVRELFEVSATSIFSKDKNHEKTWRIDAVPWSENNTEAFAGLHNQGRRILLIFDEASAIANIIWEVAEGALTDADTELIWCAFGNPTRNTGRFKDCFGKYRKRWKTRNIDSRTCKMTNKEQIKKWVEDYGEDSDFVKVRVRGMFPSMSARQFIPIEYVDRAFGKFLRLEQFSFAPKIITCDPSWEGDDDCVIGLRQGLMFKVLRVLPKNDNDVEVANIIANIEDQENADAVIIDAGYGTGIYSAGKTMGRKKWYAVWFSGKSPDPSCLNLRAYMWKQTRDWLREGGAIPKDQELYDDLIGPETIARTDGKIQLEAKKDMKKRGLPSPNKGDALALSFAIPIQSKTMPYNRRRYREQSIAQTKYNPLRRR